MNKFHNILSAKGKYWKIAETSESYVTAAQQKYGVSNLLARLLYGKSILLEEIPDFLEPKIKTFLPDPHTLIDMEKAVKGYLQP
jgi:single-stranded-DNA-specific exonuclease